MTASDRTFIYVLLWAVVIASALALVGSVLLFDGSAPTIAGIRNLWCVIAPASATDWLVHALGIGVWLAGGISLVIGLTHGRQTWRVGCEFRLLINKACNCAELHRLRSACRAAYLEHDVDLVEAEKPFAFVYGWRKPRICVSSNLVARLTERELEAVLLHERWHLRRYDPIRLAIAQTLAVMFAFVPGARALIHRYRILVEVSADHFVVQSMGTPRWLALAMYKLAQVEPVGEVRFIGSFDPRIAALTGEYPAEVSSWLLLILLLTEIALLFLFLSGEEVMVIAGLAHPIC